VDTIRIAVHGRRHAVALAQRLTGRHVYLVQHGRDLWHVCLPAADELEAEVALNDVLDVAIRFAGERNVAPTLSVVARHFQLGPAEPAAA